MLADDSYRRRATALAADFAEHDSSREQVAAILDLVGTKSLMPSRSSIFARAF